MAVADVRLQGLGCLSLLFLLSLSPPSPLAAGGFAERSDGDPNISGAVLLDAMALLMFKDCLGNPAALSSWVNETGPCSKEGPWAGVVCDDGAVTGIHLQGMGLSGVVNRTAMEALGHIPGLRSISFSDNNFSGEIPPVGDLVALKSIFISNNNFSGAIEDDFFSGMTHMKKVWLSGNAFSGKIPSSISKLPHLIELHLEDNQFSGGIPPVNVPGLKSFNVSNNKLEGGIPAGLERFEAGSFGGNSGLCGPKTGNDPCVAPPAAIGNGKEVRSGRKLLVSIVLGMLLLALATGLVVAKRRREEGFDTLGVENVQAESVSLNMPPRAASGRASGSSHHRKGSGWSKADGARGDLVMVNQHKGVFALADLMKAAAEVLGNGGLGSSYKALMADGVAVVVKRMRDLNRLSRDGFEAEIRRVGRLRHPNVLVPLAYHYRKEEKLLVYEYVEKGSLLYALHGDRGVHHAALDWPTRLKIVLGIARGMVHLHAELAPSDVPHGNLKSGNVLLGPGYEPLLVDFGFVPLINPSQASITMFAYKSPEAVQRRQVSAKSDVYCLGVVILEVITGKFPSQYLNNGKGGTDVVEWATSAVAEQREADLIDPDILTASQQSLPGMTELLRVGTACAEPSPERRLDVREAARRIEQVAAEGLRLDGDAAAPAGDGRPTLTSRVSMREHGADGFSIS